MATSGKKSDTFKRWVLTAELILVALICYVLVRLVITLINPQSVWSSPLITSVKASAVQSVGAPVFDASFDAFNRALSDDAVSAPQAPRIQVGQDAPETSLNLKLVGKRYATELSTAGAIIQTPDNQQNTFYIGQDVISGVVLESVARDFVVLSSQGRLERLSLERLDDPTVMSVDPDDTFLPLDLPSSSSQQVSSAVDISAELTMAELSMKALMSSITPVRNNGQISGYRLAKAPDGISLEDVGLQVGDVITQIGRTDLTGGIPNLAQLQTDFSAGRMTTMQVLRNGTTVTVDLN